MWAGAADEDQALSEKDEMDAQVFFDVWSGISEKLVTALAE
jgi:hypothetical protein